MAETKQLPPYAPWPTFVGFLDSLKNTAIPSRIDPSVMTKMSGTARSQVRGALIFFDLIDDNGTVFESMRSLVRAYGTDEWAMRWKRSFAPSYASIVGDLDIETASLKQLVDRFREAGLSGSVLRKAIRFYLDALKATGEAFSPHFKTRGLSVIAGDRRLPPKANGSAKIATPSTPVGVAGGVSTAPTGLEIPQGARRVDLPLKDRNYSVTLIIPSDMTFVEWTLIDTYMRAFIA